MVIKWRTVRGVRHVARIGEMGKCIAKFWSKNLKGRGQLGDLGINTGCGRETGDYETN
jgi:hypothetical protein